MRNESRKPSKPVTHVIGRRRQDAANDIALQEDSSCISQEASTDPLLISQAQSKIPSPAQRETTNPETKKEREVARHAAAERSSLTSRGAPVGVSEQQIMQLHTLQADRLHQLGQSMPLQERLHCLQKGHCLSIYQAAADGIAASGSAHALASGSAHVPDSVGKSFMDDCQERFNFFLHHYTTREECPPGVIAPPCECGIPSDLRREFEDFICLWVCAGGKCMSSEEAGYFKDGEFVEISTHFINTAASGDDLDAEARIALLEGMVQSGDTENYWDSVLAQAIVLDAGAERALTFDLDVAECDCGQPCQTVVEKVSGGLFGICRDRKCFFVYTYQEEELPKIKNMDVGQFLSIGQCTLDRYTTLHYAMRWCGNTFSQSFWNWLCHRAVDADYPKGSFQLDVGEEYTGFISYRGGSGRWRIWTTLCAEFNLAPAMYFVTIFCSLVAVCLSFVPDVCESSNASSLEWLVFADGCERPNSDRSWFIFRSYARVIVFFIIFFWHPVFSRFYRGQKWFVDKLCIHQSNPSSRATGVTRIPLFLRHSERLYVLFDPEYTTRLWCVFEMAVYMRLRENPKIVFVSIEKNMLELFFVFLAAFVALAVDSVQSATRTTQTQVAAGIVIRSDYGFAAGLLGVDDINDVGAKVSAWLMEVFLVVVYILAYLIADRDKRNMHALRETLTHFDVGKAKLASETDRVVLLGIINELFQKQDAPLDADASADNLGHAGVSAEQHGKRGSAEERIGHRLRDHITGQQSPGPVKQAADDPEADDQEVDDEEDLPQIASSIQFPSSEQIAAPADENGTTDDGLAAFNHCMKVSVRNQLPTTGIRSWSIVGYKTTVLLGALAMVQYRSLCDTLDSWGYQRTGADDKLSSFLSSGIWVGISGIPYDNWRSIVGVAFMVFVTNPFVIFMIFAHIRLWLALHAWSKLPRWTNYAFFLIAFLVIQSVLAVPWMFNQNVMNLWFELIIGDSKTSSTNQYKIFYQPLSGSTALFLLKNNIHAPSFMDLKNNETLISQ
jgi:hypothetical protein